MADPGRTSLVLVALVLAALEASGQIFSSVAHPAGPLVPPTTTLYGRGSAWADFDGDGDQDLFAAHGTSGGYVLHLRQGATWTPVTVFAPAPGLQNDRGCHVADIDRDGDPDVLVTGGPGVANRLFVNQGGGVFTEEGALRGVAFAADDAYGASFGDVDRDGHLDLYVVNYLQPAGGFAANRLLRNDGTGVFVDVTAAAGCASPGYGFATLIWDFDGDGWPDIMVGNDKGTTFASNALLRNLRDGTFADVAVPLNAAAKLDCMGLAVGDVGNDGDWDVFLPGSPGENVFLRWDAPIGAYAPQTTWTALSSTMGLVLGSVAWASHLFDADLDGRVDLGVMSENAPFSLWTGNATGGFTSVAGGGGLGAALPGGHSYCPIDFDDDGDLDVWYAGGVFPGFLVENLTAGSGAHWITVALEGTASNRDGIGAVVIVVTPGGELRRGRMSGAGYLSDGDGRLHFGLGAQTVIDRIEVRWPSGTVSHVVAPAVDQHLTVVEPDYVVSGPLTPGSTTSLDVALPADAFLPWISGLSTSVATEFPLGDGRSILVDVADPLLALTAAPGNGTLVGSQQFVPASGAVHLDLVLPPIPQLTGYAVWLIGLTWHPAHHAFVRSIVGPHRLVIQ